MDIEIDNVKEDSIAQLQRRYILQKKSCVKRIYECFPNNLLILNKRISDIFWNTTAILSSLSNEVDLKLFVFNLY